MFSRGVRSKDAILLVVVVLGVKNNQHKGQDGENFAPTKLMRSGVNPPPPK